MKNKYTCFNCNAEVERLLFGCCPPCLKELDKILDNQSLKRAVEYLRPPINSFGTKGN